MANGKKKDSGRQGYGFGTFKGVFMPSMLTILGVVMYMRFGWVLGNVGLTQTWLIVLLSTSITFLTGLSLSALATNMKVCGGGAYYIISRSLGVETGAAVGIPLYFAQATGVSFYIAGFTETLTESMGKGSWFLEFLGQYGLQDWAGPLIGVTTLAVLTVLAYFSADLALKSQFLIFVLILLSLAFMFTGGTPEPNAEFEVMSVTKVGFWVAFAVFFPAVTGIEAGIAMSGDLKDPAKSLPLGTLGAIGVSLVIYLAIPAYLNYADISEARLINDKLIMTKFISPFPLYGWINIVMWAIWGASISSAMGALLGAPRTLQALANDHIIPKFIGRGFGKGNDPRIATAITFVVAFIGIVAGDLNMIAPVLSMFFLTSYCLLNLSSAFEGLVGSPSWRPTFRVPWVVSLLGAVACIVVMIQISFGATIAAAAVSTIVYMAIQRRMRRRSLTARWSDIRSGMYMLTARKAVYNLLETPPDEKTWRPNILVLSGAPTSRWYLIELANAISQQRGFLTVAAIVKDAEGEKRMRDLEQTIRSYLTKQGIPALVRVHSCAFGVFAGARELVKSYGFGPLIPNTVMVGETEETENFVEFSILIDFIHRSKRNLIVVREGKAQPTFNPSPRIDIWWRGWTNYAAFKLALAFLITKSPDWARARIVLKNIVKSENQTHELKRMQDFIAHTRLQAEAEVIVSTDTDVYDTIRKNSEGANLVFLGIRPPNEGESPEEYSKYYEGMLQATQDMPPIIQTLNAEEVEFQRIFT